MASVRMPARLNVGITTEMLDSGGAVAAFSRLLVRSAGRSNVVASIELTIWHTPHFHAEVYSGNCTPLGSRTATPRQRRVPSFLGQSLLDRPHSSDYEL